MTGEIEILATDLSGFNDLCDRFRKDGYTVSYGSILYGGHQILARARRSYVNSFEEIDDVMAEVGDQFVSLDIVFQNQLIIDPLFQNRLITDPLFDNGVPTFRVII